MKRNPDVNVLASQTASYSREQAVEVTENLLQRNPNVAAVLAGNDEMALGAIVALESIGKPGKILVIGADGSPDALMALEAGRLTATVDYMGYEMVHVHRVGRSPPQRGKTGGARSHRPVPPDR